MAEVDLSGAKLLFFDDYFSLATHSRGLMLIGGGSRIFPTKSVILSYQEPDDGQ